jgi:hypothetical protein
MAKAGKRLLSKSKMRARTRKIVTDDDDIDMLFRLAELYNTNYDFEAAEWFWGEYRETTTFEEFRNKVLAWLKIELNNNRKSCNSKICMHTLRAYPKNR